MLAEQYHFVGIGGIGMSALARILLQQNIRVSGSDQSHNPIIEQLRVLGACISIGHDVKHIPKNATLIISTDIHEDNVELLYAKR